MVDVLVQADALLRRAEQLASAGDELFGGGELLSMDGADGVRGMTDRLAAAGERLLPGLVLVGEDSMHVLDDGIELAADRTHQ